MGRSYRMEAIGLQLPEINNEKTSAIARTKLTETATAILIFLRFCSFYALFNLKISTVCLSGLLTSQ